MLRFSASLLCIVTTAAISGGCPDEPRRPIGAACEDHAMCASGVCGEGMCLEAGADTDGDTLTNELEVRLGSNPVAPDTDGDGIPDGGEFNRADLSNVDTDGDGVADIVESATLDPDGDCIPDQYDAQNTIPNSDLSPMIDVVCSTAGVCAGQRAHFGVTCPAGTATCIYAEVPGYVSPETACDAIDQNCDGSADDGFPDRDGDDVADCVDTDWDNDGVADAGDGGDNCPTVANQDQADADADGIGDACVTAYRLRFVDQPPDAVSGVALIAPVSVALTAVDAATDAPPMPVFVGRVTLAIDTGTVAGVGATLGGTTAVDAVLGLATFADLVVTGAGTGLVLRATSGALGAGESDPFDVTPSGPGRIAIEGLTTSAVAGVARDFEVVVYDALDRVQTDFAGTITFASSDLAATLPVAVTLSAADGGRKAVAVTFLSAGAQTLDATTDAGSGALTTRAHVDIGNAAASVLEVVPAAASVTSGTPFAVTVRARDAFGNVAVDYAGTVTLTTSDAAASVPAAHPFTAGDAGVYVFDGIELAARGTQTIDATDAGGLSGQATVAVNPSAPALLALVAAPETAVAGAPFDVVVELRDARGNVVDDSASSLAVTTTDARIATRNVPTSTARTTVTLTLETAGTQTVTLTDVVSGLVRSVSVSVTPSGVAAFELTIADAIVGVQTIWTIRALDAFGNVATGFVGEVVLTSSDTRATFPGVVTFGPAEAGVQAVVYSAATAGAQTVTAASGGITASAHPSFAPGAAQSLRLVAPASTVAGDAISVVVTALDAFGNHASGYRGSVTLTATDGAAVLPGAHVFDAGDAGSATIANVILKTAGNVTVTAADGAQGALRATASVAVSARAASVLEVVLGDDTVPAGVTTHAVVTALDAFGNVDRAYLGKIGAASSDPLATLPEDVTFGADDHGQLVLSGFVFRTLGAQTVTITDRATPALTGTDGIAVDAGADVILRFENLPANGVAGVDFDLALVAEDLFGNRVSDYAGTVRLSSNEASGALAVEHAFAPGASGDNGRFVFTEIALHEAANITVRAVDLADARVQTSGVVKVRAAAVAALALTSDSPVTVAGAALTATVTAYDAFGNLVTDYAGTVTITADDTQATLPDSTQFAPEDGGRRAFELILRTAGAHTVTASDGTQSDGFAFDVAPAGASQLTLEDLPATVVAGAAHTVRLTVRDAFGNRVPTFTGSAALTSTDTAVEVATPVTFAAPDAGTVTFAVTFHSAGDRLLSANAGGSLVASASTHVDPGAPARIDVTGLATNVVAGELQNLTASVRDSDGNVVTGFVGAPAVTSTDSQASFPASLLFGAGDLGMRPLAVTFGTAGLATVTVDAGSGVRGSATTTVAPGAGASFTLSALPVQVAAGSVQALTIVVRDSYGNPATGYAGVFTVTLSDAAGTAPASVTLAPADGGQKTFNVTMRTAGTQTVTVANTLGSHDASTIVRSAGSVASIDVSALPSTVVAGSAKSLTLRLLDPFGNLVTSYAGAVTITSTDGAATFPPSIVFGGTEGGTKTFDVVLKTAGERTVAVSADAGTLTDSTTTTVKSAAGAVIVFASVPANATAGTPFGATVRVNDPYGNQADGYRGAVSFTSSDAGAILPASYTFTVADAGAHPFASAFTLVKSGPQTLIATGTTLTTSQVTATIQVAPGSAHHASLTLAAGNGTAGVPFDAIVTVRDAHNNVATGYTGTVTFSANDPNPSLPGAYPFVAGDGGVHTFAGGVTLRRAQVATVSVSGTTLTVNPATADKTIVGGAITKLLVDPLAPPYDVGVAMTPALRAAAADAYDNVSPQAATIAFDLYYNGGRGRLGGTTSRAASGAYASFADLTIDKPGTYGLRARLTSPNGIAPVLLPYAAFRHAAPQVAITPVAAGRGCTSVDFVLTQAASAPVDVELTYHVGIDTAFATLDGKAALGGTHRLATSPTGVTHTLVWNHGVDLPRQDVQGVTLSITARTSDGKTGSATSNAFDVLNAWDPTYTTTALPAGFKSSGAAVGDIDRNGHDDVVLADGGSATFRVFFARADGTFVVQSVSYDAGQFTPTVRSVALADIDRDGVLDVVLGDWDNNRMYALETTLAPGNPAVASFAQFSDTGLHPCDQQQVPPYITSLSTTDYDQDGATDLMVGCGGGQVVIGTAALDGSSVYLSQLTTIALDSQEIPIAAIAGDFVGDGTRAVLVGATNPTNPHGFGATVYVYWDGIWLPWAQFGMPEATGVAAGDYNRDGKMDVAVLDVTRHLDLFWGDVAFSVSGTLDLATVAASTDALASADVDHDGRTEFAIGSVTDDSVAVLRSDDWRDAVPFSVTAVDTGSAANGGATALFVRDFDRDGRRDLAVVRRDATASAALGLVRGSDAARCGVSFGAPAGAPVTDISAVDVVLEDVDGDGKLDATFLRSAYGGPNGQGSPGVHIAYGDGGGGFAAAAPVTIDTTQRVVEAAYADVGGDGRLDLVVLTDDAAGDPGEIHVFQQASATAWSELATSFGGASAGLIVDDIDLDGDIDIAFSQTNGVGLGATFRIFLQAADHTFSQAHALTAGGVVTAVAAADLNFDGVLDFALKRTSLLGGNNDVCLVRSTGASWPANLSASPCLGLDGAAADLFAFQDVTGDGWVELVAHSELPFGTEGSAPVTIFHMTSDGTATFLAAAGNPESTTLCGGGLGRVALGDIDGDAREDLVASCGVGPGALWVFFQSVSGSPRFADNDAIAFGTGTLSNGELAVGRFDGHGPDVLYDGSIYHFTPDGSKTDDPPRLAVVEDPYAMIRQWVVADFNRDGFADFAATDDNHADTFDVAYSSGAPESFTYAMTYVPGLANGLDLIGVGDVSADGRDDLVLTVGYGDTSQVILELWDSQAPTGFSYDSGYSFTLPATPSALAFGDLSYDAPNNGPYADTRVKALIALAMEGPDQVSLLRRLDYSGYDVVHAYADGGVDFPDVVYGLAAGRFSGDQAATIALVGSCVAPTAGPCVVIARLGFCPFFDGFDCITTEAQIPIDGYPSHAVTATAFGDLNNDGFTDIAVGLTETAAAGGTSEVVVLRQDASNPGSFILDAVGLKGSPGIDWLGLADVDGDGRLDLVATRKPELAGACRTPEVALQQAAGAVLTFASRAATPSDGACALGATIFDYNRDGRPDVMTLDALGTLRPLVQR